MTSRPAPRIPVVGVMGSGSEPDNDKAAPLGWWLARSGVHLLTGGGGGVMTTVAKAFVTVPDRRGLSIGVLPALGPSEEEASKPAPGYPNPWIELPIRTHLHQRGNEGSSPLSRNHVNVLSADVVVALAGSEGTASEVQLALRYGRPVIAHLDSPDQIPDLPATTPWSPRLEDVQDFVLRHLPGTPR